MWSLREQVHHGEVHEKAPSISFCGKATSLRKLRKEIHGQLRIEEAHAEKILFHRRKQRSNLATKGVKMFYSVKDFCSQTVVLQEPIFIGLLNFICRKKKEWTFSKLLKTFAVTDIIQEPLFVGLSNSPKTVGTDKKLEKKCRRQCCSVSFIFSLQYFSIIHGLIPCSINWRRQHPDWSTERPCPP